MIPEVVLAYEMALRALDARDLESTRLFIEIARVLRDTPPRQPRRLRKLRSIFRLRGQDKYC
ncbi:hypothetical protein KEJ51_00640 [Candidatus Bathyarchaeota archaeon]|nr:hypothetical protein [Candidatus Bathyarchaeota archaeon]MBS7628682.1 hypothetical protein [Candidatus Bathyarchaeota archaeon]